MRLPLAWELLTACLQKSSWRTLSPCGISAAGLMVIGTLAQASSGSGTNCRTRRRILEYFRTSCYMSTSALFGMGVVQLRLKKFRRALLYERLRRSTEVSVVSDSL